MSGMIRILFSLLCAGLLLTGCKNKEDAILKLSASQWYDRGNQFLKLKKGSDAVEAFEKVVQYYPYDSVAPDAQIELIRAHRIDGTHESAVANADAFLQIYPAHTRANEALFLKALSYFDQVTGEREETHAVKALATFRDLRLRAPEFNKKEREDCETLLHNILVSTLMKQALSYWRRKAIFPAISRYTEALKYPKNNFTNEAAYRLVECFLSISLDKEALHCAQRIDKNTMWHTAAQKLIAQTTVQRLESTTPTNQAQKNPGKHQKKASTKSKKRG